jgi:thiol:disulfide interchange protein
MQSLRQLLGFLLFAAGIWLVSKDIIFTSQGIYYWWRPFPAAGSVISFLGGLWILFTARPRNQFIGWILIGLGIALVFFNSGIVLRPVNLGVFLGAFSLLFAGFKLMNPRRFYF